MSVLDNKSKGVGATWRPAGSSAGHFFGSENMTAHKLSPEINSGQPRPFGVGVSFQHDLSDLGEAVLKTRVIQAFENAATHYAIHRLVRCAVRRKIEDTFDDLALGTGFTAQRLDLGSLLLDGPGVFVHADGKEKSGYCTCTFKVWASSKERAEDARQRLLRAVGDRQLPEEMFVLNWQFSNGQGHLLSASFEELARETVHDEAYPMLGEPVDELVRRYLCANDTVLVLQGPPGTGKTRLVRYILGEMSQRKQASAEVMYTADKRALENDAIFVDFITGSHDAFVIEDADHLLQARSNGNHDIHRFLAIADGVVRAQGRKIIFTSNLPNVGDIDEALLRPGRCFAVVRTRTLTLEEADRLIVRLCGRDTEACWRARAMAIPPDVRGASVAEVYRACAEAAASGPRGATRHSLQVGVAG